MKLLYAEKREPGIDVPDGHWSTYPAGSHEREEALFLEGMRMNIAPQYLHHHCGLTHGEIAACCKRMLAKGKLSNLSRYARLVQIDRRERRYKGRV